MSHEPGATVEHKPHVLPIKIYAAVWIGLLILSVVTVWISYFDFGVLNLFIAMGIATVKATLVVLFFMHLKYDERFNAVVFVSSLAFLGVFFMFTLADTMERGKVDPLEQDVIVPVPARKDVQVDAGHGETGEAATDETGAHEDSTSGSGDGGH